MNFKKVFLYIFLGFCLGGMFMAIIDKANSRVGNWGGEALFIPCAVMLIWFGWTIKSQLDLLKKTDRKRKYRRNKNECGNK